MRRTAVALVLISALLALQRESTAALWRTRIPKSPSASVPPSSSRAGHGAPTWPPPTSSAASRMSRCSITIARSRTSARPSGSIRQFARAFANRGAVHGAKQDFDKAIGDF